MIAKTPETDKMYDMVSDREAPNYNMVGHLPSKWSYEAILDLTDHARRLERQRDAAVDDRVEAQRLGMQAMDEAAALRHDIERAVQRNSDLLAEVETVAVANCPSLCDEFCNAYQVHAALVRLEAELAAIKAAQPSAISDERIREIGKDAFGIDLTFDGNLLRFARAIIAAAQEGK